MSKRPHFHRAYLVTVCNQKLIAVAVRKSFFLFDNFLLWLPTFICYRAGFSPNINFGQSDVVFVSGN